jgi:hypothetical protein
MRKALLCAAGLLCACGGNYSNDDLLFASVLPSRQALEAKLPTQGQSQSGLGGQRAGLNLGQTADFYQGTHEASATFNGALTNLLGFIDTVRTVSPTSRTEDSRTWGPFPSKDQPGYLAEVVMVRDPSGRFTYRVAFRRNAAGSAWFSLLDGAFLPSEDLRKGDGELHLHVQAVRDQGLPVSADLAQLSSLDATYSTRAPPLRVDMLFSFVPGASFTQLGYQYREQADGQGAMRFAFVQSSQTFTLTSRWQADGGGRADGTVTAGAYVGATQTECWDTGFLLRYESRSWDGSTLGDPGQCPTLAPWQE